MRIPTILKLTALVSAASLMAASATTASTTTGATCVFETAEWTYYEGDPSYPGSDVIGYQIRSCDCVLHTYGGISEFVVYTPIEC